MHLSTTNRIRLLYFFSFCCQAAWAPRFADFLVEKQLNAFQLGLVLSITPAMMFLFQPLYGYIADKVGHKKTLLSGALLAALFFLGHYLEGGWYFTAFVTVMMSLFFNATQPIIDSLALDAVDAGEQASYGEMRIAGAAAWSLTGLVTGYMIDWFGLPSMFVPAALAMALTFLLAMDLPERRRGPAVEKEESQAGIRTVLGNRALLLFLLLTLVVSVAATSMWNFYSMFMHEIGASGKLTGYGFTLQGICELPLFYYSARIIGRLGLKKTLTLTLAVTALRMLLYSWVKDPQWALLIELTHGVSWSLFWVACVELTNSMVKESWRATGQSLLYAAYFGIGAIAGNFWTSYLYEHISLGEIFLLNAGITAVAALAAWGLIRNAPAAA